MQDLAPAGWAAKAIAIYRRLSADTLVAEVNQDGGEKRAFDSIVTRISLSLRPR